MLTASPYHSNENMLTPKATTKPKAEPPKDFAAPPVNDTVAVGWALTDPVASTVLLAEEMALMVAEDGV